MRIQKTSYVVMVGKTAQVISMTQVVGLKIRELVPVRAKQAKRK